MTQSSHCNRHMRKLRISALFASLTLLVPAANREDPRTTGATATAVTFPSSLKRTIVDAEGDQEKLIRSSGLFGMISHSRSFAKEYIDRERWQR